MKPIREEWCVGGAHSGNHEVQAFSPDRSYQSFAERIPLRSSDRSLEGHSERSDGRVQFGGEPGMAIMNEEPVGVIAR